MATFRPFKDGQEFMSFLKKSKTPFIMTGNAYEIVQYIDNEGVVINNKKYSYQEIIDKNFQFDDETYCGRVNL